VPDINKIQSIEPHYYFGSWLRKQRSDEKSASSHGRALHLLPTGRNCWTWSTWRKTSEKTVRRHNRLVRLWRL